jgi:hypothetical protein
MKQVIIESDKEGFPFTAMREINLLRLVDHKNIVKLLEVVTSQGEKYKKNINQSRYENHNLPFEQLKVGPGVGLEYDDGPTGGFHQDIRKYQLPKTVDNLRAKNNPRVSYTGRIVKGKKEIKRDSGYYFTKNKHAVMAVGKAQFRNAGVAKETKRSDIYIKDNNRKISKEIMGPAGSIISLEIFLLLSLIYISERFVSFATPAFRNCALPTAITACLFLVK